MPSFEQSLTQMISRVTPAGSGGVDDQADELLDRRLLVVDGDDDRELGDDRGAVAAGVVAESRAIGARSIGLRLELVIDAGSVFGSEPR